MKKISKLDKVLLIITIISAISLIVTCIVMYVLYPVQTKAFIMNAWDWLNEPIPIVGVSTLMILIFAWQVFKNSSFGRKQLLELKRLGNDTKDTIEAVRAEKDTQIANLQSQVEYLSGELEKFRNNVAEALMLVPNKKVKELGEKINGKEREETVNNEAKAN